MDLTPFVDTVRRELAIAAEAGGPDARALAERLTAPLASALRLSMLEALSAAADEITRDLAPGSVEVRLRAGDVSFAVTLPPGESPAPAGSPLPGPAAEPAESTDGRPSVDDGSGADDEGAMARINVRLPEHLKTRIEDAASAQGRSVNAWLVRAASAALQPAGAPPPSSGTRRTSQRYTGWVS